MRREARPCIAPKPKCAMDCGVASPGGLNAGRPAQANSAAKPTAPSTSVLGSGTCASAYGEKPSVVKVIVSFTRSIVWLGGITQAPFS